MALALLLSALLLHGIATSIAVRLAWTSRRISWTALALAVGLMGVWRTVSVYDAVDYDVALDLGTELLAGVISLLTVIGMRTASRTLAKLRRSEDRLRAVVDSAMDAIVVVDDTGRIRYANPAVEHVERAEIVRTVVTLARHLELDVVAEGVETSSELARLREYGCDLAQGFFFSRPVERDTAEALVAREVEVLDATRRSDRPLAAPQRRQRSLVA